MRLFKWTVISRRFYSYKKVVRPESFKIVDNPIDTTATAAKILDAKIQANGPITVADYMKIALTNPHSGYYMRRDAIGRKGDFITSPEISQIFGELIGIWICNELRKIANPTSWQLIELGPGRGTLLSDVLRVLKLFKLTNGLSVHLVEVSPNMSAIQSQILCNDIVPIGAMPRNQEGPHYKSSKTSDNVQVFWYNKIEEVPRGFSVILAHEFFDAIPIHKFQKSSGEWREILIDSKRDENGNIKFDYVLSNNEDSVSKLLIKKDETRDHVEVCPEGGSIVNYVSDLLVAEGGFSLFIDYGHDGEKTDTFRGFKNHQLHDPLVEPGSADLTADVDFSFMREIMKDKLLTFGPVEQSDFLTSLGIKTRLERLLKVATRDQARHLESGYRMLVDKDKMGARYKCFAAFPLVLKEHLEKFPVLGFRDISY